MRRPFGHILGLQMRPQFQRSTFVFLNTLHMWGMNYWWGPLNPVSLGYKILCRVPAILFFHGLPPIQPFYSESHAHTKFSTLAFSQGFFFWQSSSHPVEPQVSRCVFRDTFLGIIIALPKKIEIHWWIISIVFWLLEGLWIEQMDLSSQVVEGRHKKFKTKI